MANSAAFPTQNDIRGASQKNEQYLRAHWPEFYKHLQTSYPGDSIPVQLYMYFNHISEHPKCTCGKPLEYISPGKGFRSYCSSACKYVSREFKDKIIKTQKERYGGVGFASHSLYEKAVTTNLRRYGVSNSMKSDVYKAKQRDTLERNYGVRCPAHNPELMKKAKQTQEERYGGFGMASPELMKKAKQTQEERYGGFGMASEIIRKKSRDTLLNLYGVEYNGQRPEVILKSKHSRVKSIREKYPIIQSVTWRDGMKIFNCSCPHPETCHRCPGTFRIYNEHFFRRLQDGTELCTVLLPYQHPHQSNTSVEVFIKMILDELGVQYIQNDRSIISPREVDFYLPAHKIAIECNGIRWHSTEFKDKQYHKLKHQECAERGIQLLTIWEDWIVNTPNVVASIIRAKLGQTTNKIWARKCVIKEVELMDANNFLMSNHIQGRCVSSVRYGLYFNNELVSLMTFGKKRPAQGNKTEVWELIRFCNKLNTSIPGAASKLLSQFIKTYKPQNIISFSSNDISNGNLYSILGFKQTSSSHSYWYVGRDFKRHHRFAFCKSKLVKKGYDPDKTEFEIMRTLPYYCIYDSGQTKWTLQLA